MEKIKVHVVKMKDRKNWSMRYLDPYTGNQVFKSSGTTKKYEAIREAAKWEADIHTGRYSKSSRMGWEEFRDYLYTNHLAAMGDNTITAYETSLNVFEKFAKPKRLADITTARVTAFATSMRKKGSSPATVHRHLNHIKVLCNWARKQNLLSVMPVFTMPKLPKGMRGRPITLEEFERMLSKVADVVGEKAAGSWRFYLQGLQTSGLRLEESLKLRWDDGPEAIVVDYSGKRPRFRISAEAEKGKTHRLLPMAPEFAVLLEEVPSEYRRGWVFRPLAKLGAPYARTRHTIGPRVTKIGKAAGVITDRRIKKGVEVVSYAGAHDLRRSFGFRWSRLLMPAELRELMRHVDISTTMKFYVGVNADVTAEKLWEVAGLDLGSALGSARDGKKRGNQKTTCF
jgi:integrase